MATKQYADINGLTEFYDGIVQKISDDLASYYTKTQVDSLISAITTLDIEVVQTLPTQDISQTTIYLVPKSTAQTSNTYDEYINTDGTSAGWELIGSTAIDLSGYVQKSQTAGLLKNDGTVDTVPKASQASVNAILDGQSIDSFGDVETALGDKLDVTRVAPEFQDDVAYTKGQYVTRNGYILRFKTDHSAGAFNPQEVYGVTIGDVLADKEYITNYNSGDFLVMTGEDSSTGYTTNTVSLNKATAPTQSDAKPITSGGVYTAIEKKPNIFTGTTAEWNTLTSAQKSAYTIVNLTDDFVYSRLSDIYSTDERVVGVWMGKPLYQKTYPVTLPNTNYSPAVLATVDLVSNIDFINISSGNIKIISGNNIYYCLLNDINFDTNDTFIPLTRIWVSNENDVSTYKIMGKIGGRGRANATGYVTIQYTKTTDA